MTLEIQEIDWPARRIVTSDISESASRLQKRRLIRSVRSAIIILERDGLEAGACECRGSLATARRWAHLEPTQSSHPATLPSVI